jgi:hypothetical protein
VQTTILTFDVTAATAKVATAAALPLSLGADLRPQPEKGFGMNVSETDPAVIWLSSRLGPQKLFLGPKEYSLWRNKFSTKNICWAQITPLGTAGDGEEDRGRDGERRGHVPL